MTSQPHTDRFLSATKTAGIVGVSRQTLWSWVKRGHFPPSRKVGPSPDGKAAWLQSEVLEWMQNRGVAIGPDDVGEGV